MTDLKAGPELDALVAERVMGTVPCDDWRGFHAARGEWIRNEPHEGHKCYPRECCPAYSMLISAAWQVVEKMRSNDWWYAISHDRDGVEVEFWKSPKRNYQPGPGTYENADTAPLAICLAALKAVQQ